VSLIMKFCGAAGTVTGSCYWLRHGSGEFLVDCGMFQGSIDPSRLDFVLLTHAHIDHSGLLPKLRRDGFTGKAFATQGTKDLLSFMLPDSGYIQESEVAFLNRRNAQRGVPTVTPIYSREDGEAAAESIAGVDYQTWFEPGRGVRARLWNAGHILGSASIEIEVSTGRRDQRIMRLLFSGDIGPENSLFHPSPEAPTNLDYVVSEATYGARRRESLSADVRLMRFSKIVAEAFARGGVLLIPAFSVERTQELLADLSVLIDQGSIRATVVFLDSPLAIQATEVFARHAGELEGVSGDGALFRNPAFHFTRSVDESKAINRYEAGVIIIAASGMCEAGRVRHHLKQRLSNSKNTVLLTGYQAPGTLGSFLEAGRKAVRIQGDDIRVNAHIESIDFYSGHVDADGLVEWMKARRPVARAAFLTHGDEDALAALRDRLAGAGFTPDRILIPRLDDEVDLFGDAGVAPRAAPRRLPPETVGALDWHNDLAQLSLDIRERLESAADEKSKGTILRRLRRALEGEGNDARRS
jgi:metallo-beta-lactamase family protein